MHPTTATPPAAGSTSNLRIKSLEPLVPPARLCALLPLEQRGALQQRRGRCHFGAFY
jgi:hypothetical protein